MDMAGCIGESRSAIDRAVLSGAAQMLPLLVHHCQFLYDCKGCGTRLKPKAGIFLFLRLSTVPAKTGGELVLLKHAF